MKKDNKKFLRYTCPKCGNRDYKLQTVSTTGGLFSKIFDIQHLKFTAVICTKCTYSELYQTKSNQIANVFDFFTN
jgi:uncharacterized protein